MKYSFIIITCGKRQDKVNSVIYSILEQGIPKEDFEIIVVGGSDDYHSEIINTRFISFNDSQKPKPWITRKKNLGTFQARGEVCIYIHDYITLKPGWHDGMKKFGDDFDAMVCPMEYENGMRAIDWVLCPHDRAPDNKLKSFIDKKIGHVTANDLIRLPYNIAPNGEISRYFYMPGNAYIIKTNKSKEFLLDESLLWDDSEDLNLSARFTKKYNIKLNINSGFKFFKGGRPIGHRECPKEICDIIKEFVELNKQGLI